MSDINELIYSLELELQKPEVRQSIEKLDSLVSDNLMEVTSSGKISNKSDCLANLPKSPKLDFVMSDFKTMLLSPDLVLSMFKTKKTIVDSGHTSYSARTTIWKNETGKWKMIFHQGTPIPNA